MTLVLTLWAIIFRVNLGTTLARSVCQAPLIFSAPRKKRTKEIKNIDNNLFAMLLLYETNVTRSNHEHLCETISAENAFLKLSTPFMKICTYVCKLV